MLRRKLQSEAKFWEERNPSAKALEHLQGIARSPPCCWASQVVLMVKNLPAMQETCRRHRFDHWVRKIP